MPKFNQQPKENSQPYEVVICFTAGKAEVKRFGLVSDLKKFLRWALKQSGNLDYLVLTDHHAKQRIDCIENMGAIQAWLTK